MQKIPLILAGQKKNSSTLSTLHNNVNPLSEKAFETLIYRVVAKIVLTIRRNIIIHWRKKIQVGMNSTKFYIKYRIPRFEYHVIMIVMHTGQYMK